MLIKAVRKAVFRAERSAIKDISDRKTARKAVSVRKSSSESAFPGFSSRTHLLGTWYIEQFRLFERAALAINPMETVILMDKYSFELFCLLENLVFELISLL